MRRHISGLAALIFITFILSVGIYPAKTMAATQGTLSGKQLEVLRDKWQIAFYTLETKEQKIQALQELEKEASVITARYPHQAEPKIWWAIILSSEASLIKNRSVLKKAEQSRDLFFAAIEIDPEAMNGAAFNMLGTLYHQLPGWPFAYGSDEEAEKYYLKALEIDPDNMNANFMYATFLFDNRRYKDALQYILQAQQAKIRPGYKLADSKDQKDIEKLKAKILKKM